MTRLPNIGIDLGTTYSLLATADSGGVSVIPNAEGERSTPSFVQVDGENIVVGTHALRAARMDPDNVIGFFKRDMGTDARYSLGGRVWTPVDLSAAVLGKLRVDAEAELGAAIEEAVVTVPAYFRDDARIATRAAGAAAGLNVREMIHEPTAAALAFGFRTEGQPRAILVYDLGGGTFDVSVVRFGADQVEVVATAGDHALGGKDWDEVIMELAGDRFCERHGLNPSDDDIAEADLRERAEEAKRSLSTVPTTSLMVVSQGAVDRIELSRAEVESHTAHLLERTERLIQQTLEDASLDARDLDAVLLVGGSTRMPACAELVSRITGLEVLTGVDPDEAVARGAALKAAASREPAASALGLARAPDVLDVTAHALGFVVIGADGTRYVNEVMIQRNARIPAEETKVERVTTTAAGPNELHVYLLQGDRQRPLETTPLGRYTFAHVPHRRRSYVDVAVSFRYDDDGVVHVSASADGHELAQPTVDRADRDLAWTDEDPREHVKRQQLAAVLTIDCSGSMSGRALDEAKAACEGFAAELGGLEGVELALVSFASGARVETALGKGPMAAARAARGLSVYGGTDMVSGLKEARRLLGGGDASARRVIVLLTDGMPNNGEATLTEAELCRRDDIEIIPRGVTGADEAFLRRIASTDEASFMTSLDDVAASFRGIARQLAVPPGRGSRFGLLGRAR